MNGLILALSLLGNADFEQLVDALGAPVWRDREAATMMIARSHQDCPLETIEQRLDREDLSQEQRTRLLKALTWRYELLPRAALGVEMTKWVGDPGEDGPAAGLRVERVIRGLPAHDFLRRGDVITHMDDMQMTEQSDLLSFVNQHWPGDRVRVRAARLAAGVWVPIDTEISLGSMATLRGQGTLMRRSPPMDERRLLTRLRRTHLPLARTLEGPTDPGRGSPLWIVAEVERQREALANRPDDGQRANALARWRTWLKAVDARLGDRFLEGQRRTELQAARAALEEALEEAIGGEDR